MNIFILTFHKYDKAFASDLYLIYNRSPAARVCKSDTDRLLMLYLVLINSPTRVTEGSKSLLDVIIVSETKQVQKAGVMESSISDHDLVYVALRLRKARTKPVFITTRSFKHYNSQAFNNDVALAPWSIVDAFDDVEDKLHAFNSLFNDILDKHAPIKTFKIRGRPNPCVTENIRELMKTRDRWRKRAKETNDPEAWIEYKNLKHKVRSEIMQTG